MRYSIDGNDCISTHYSHFRHAPNSTKRDTTAIDAGLLSQYPWTAQAPGILEHSPYLIMSNTPSGVDVPSG